MPKDHILTLNLGFEVNLHPDMDRSDVEHELSQKVAGLVDLIYTELDDFYGEDAA